MRNVVTLNGTAVERGIAYGESARALIVEAAARWEAELGSDREDVLRALVDASGFRATATRVTPALVEELDGIALGSGVDHRLVWALNLLDETWWVRRQDRG